MSSDAEFRFARSFRIDNGELDGFSPQECFVLGYELAVIDDMLAGGDSIAQPVHAANRERIEESCRQCERDFSLTYMSDDASETWMVLKVAALEV